MKWTLLVFVAGALLSPIQSRQLYGPFGGLIGSFFRRDPPDITTFFSSDAYSRATKTLVERILSTVTKTSTDTVTERTMITLIKTKTIFATIYPTRCVFNGSEYQDARSDSSSMTLLPENVSDQTFTLSATTKKPNQFLPIESSAIVTLKIEKRNAEIESSVRHDEGTVELFD